MNKIAFLIMCLVFTPSLCAAKRSAMQQAILNIEFMTYVGDTPMRQNELSSALIDFDSHYDKLTALTSPAVNVLCRAITYTTPAATSNSTLASSVDSLTNKLRDVTEDKRYGYSLYHDCLPVLDFQFQCLVSEDQCHTK